MRPSLFQQFRRRGPFAQARVYERRQYFNAPPLIAERQDRREDVPGLIDLSGLSALAQQMAERQL